VGPVEAARGLSFEAIFAPGLAEKLFPRRIVEEPILLADGGVVGHIFNANAAPVGTPWMWTLAFGHHEDRSRRTTTRRGGDGRVRQELAEGVKPLGDNPGVKREAEEDWERERWR